MANDKLFDDEPKIPPLGNLATHIRTKHPNIEELVAKAAADANGPQHPGLTRGISAASAKIIDDYLTEGKLHPKREPTQQGFYKVFAAWILEDDLPFTTGETGGIARLYKYMQSRFLLPSDTTVRNSLAKIYAEMYAQVKNELKVSHTSEHFNLLSHRQHCYRVLNRRLQPQQIPGLPSP